VAAPIVAGALLAWLLEGALRRRAAAAGQPYDSFAEAANRRGVLMAAIIGAAGTEAPLAIVGEDFAGMASYLGLAVFVMVAVLFWRRVMRLA